MTISFSQNDYWEFVQSTRETDAAFARHHRQQEDELTDECDRTWRYPKPLGEGYYREMQIREGLDLAIADYCLHDDLIVTSSDREHPLELTYTLVGVEPSELTPIRAGQHTFCGSGMAPGEVRKMLANRRSFWVSIHVEPALLCQWMTGNLDCLPSAMSHLVKPSDRTLYAQSGTTTAAMQMALQQMLQCPFQGLTKRMYLESKVWELMALQLAQTRETGFTDNEPKPLKPEDIERIHYAKEVLLSRLNNPPSLIELARLVGINDCKLKVGFRQVFGTTVFGYLHDCRMERSRQLLEAGEMTVARAAQAVGFANRSHFAIAFRKKFGINPSIYRRKMLNEFKVG
jgi:AraC-like DNA-binding protein